MSQSVATADIPPAEEHAESGVGEAPLTLLLGKRWALGLKHLAVTALFGLFFVYLTYVPLFHTDLWDHVVYGQHILKTGQLPAEDPFLKLAEGVPIVATMWLSQVLMAGVVAWGGPAALSPLYAVTLLATYLVLAVAFYRITGRLSAAVLGVALVFAVVGWNRHLVIRPEMFGWLFYAVLLLLVSSVEITRQRRGLRVESPLRTELRYAYFWLGLPVLFALWANMHGSYVCGLAVLACCFAGRVLEVGWRKRDFWAVVRDAWVRRWLVAGEVAVAATLVNPYGIDLLLHNLLFAGHENLRDVLEWVPLTIESPVFWGFLLTWVLFLVVLRFSPRRIRPADVLLVGLFTYASLTYVRMLGWYAPVAALVLMPHLGQLLRRRLPRTELAYVSPLSAHDVPLWRRASWSYTLCCLGMLWISFCLTSFYAPMRTGQPRNPERLYSKQTPYKATAWLRENRPDGQIWNTQMWGGWLLYDTQQPGREPLEVFTTTNIHVLPPTVWRDYLRVFTASGNWSAVLDRYRVNTVLADKSEQPQLILQMRRSPEWRVRYEDSLAVVFQRVPPRALTSPTAAEVVPATVEEDSAALEDPQP